MRFSNSTWLNSELLEALVLRHTAPYRHDGLTVRFRLSRGADFSGACYYRDSRIFVNLGRHNRYPYPLATHLAKARATRTGWRREVFILTLADAYQLGLFIYLHELFHYLTKQAGRSPRRKEAMCDRFAARTLIDHYGCPVQRRDGALVAREDWDFQDLAEFVAAAPRNTRIEDIPVTVNT